MEDKDNKNKGHVLSVGRGKIKGSAIKVARVNKAVYARKKGPYTATVIGKGMVVLQEGKAADDLPYNPALDDSLENLDANSDNTTGSSLDALSEYGIDVAPLEAGYKSKDAIIKYGQQLRKMRNEVGMTQEELAKAADMAQADISRLERGLSKVGPSLDTMSRLADACEHNFSVILDSQRTPETLNEEITDSETLSEIMHRMPPTTMAESLGKHMGKILDIYIAETKARKPLTQTEVATLVGESMATHFDPIEEIPGEYKILHLETTSIPVVSVSPIEPTELTERIALLFKQGLINASSQKERVTGYGLASTRSVATDTPKPTSKNESDSKGDVLN